MAKTLLAAIVAAGLLLGTSEGFGYQAANPDTFVEQFDGAKTQLDAAEAYVRQEQFAEAAELLQKLIDAHGDRIVALSQAPNRHVKAGLVANQRIARLPAEGMTAYRRLIDGRANSLWAQYQKSGDSKALQSLLDRYPNSSIGAAAYDAAAERAFAAGRWSQACFFWASILPAEFTDLWTLTATLRTGSDTRLVVRDAKIDEAATAAKWIAGLLLLQESRSAQSAVALFAKKFPNARGRLGGMDGKYVDLLQRLERDSAGDAARGNDNRWSTFAGNAARNRSFGKPLEIGDVQQSWPLDDGPQRNGRNAGPLDEPARGEDQPSIHPVIDGNQVIVATERYLRTMHLDTGKAENWHDFQGEQNSGRGEGSGKQRYTLTIAGDRLFVRTGQESESIRPHRWMVQMPSVESRLYCFDYKKQRMLWEQNARDVMNNNNYLFEGPPIVDGANAYVGMTRVDAMAETDVVCLDAQTGRLKWRTVVCEASNEPGTRMGLNHGLLTIGEGTLFYCTNLGAIAALEMTTGKLRWIVTYNRGRRVTTNPSYGYSPDVNPCVYDRGRLFVAPGDSLSMYCLHAETGQQLWENQWPVAHLLGVGHGNLIVTGNRVLAIDVASGKVKWYWPQNTAAGYGRGMLAGDFVYWPTKTELHVLEQSTGQKARPTVPLSERFRLRGGNLAAVGANLILTQSDRVVAMAPYARLIKRLQAEIVKNAASAPLHFQLADAAAANNDFATAARHFELAAKHAKASDKVEGEPIAALAPAKLYRVHMDAAEHFRRQGDSARYAAAFESAFASAPPGNRLNAILEIVASLERAGDMASTARWLKRVCADDSLAALRIIPEGRTRVSGAVWATGKLVALTQGGGEPMGEWERDAQRVAQFETDGEKLRAAAARWSGTRAAALLATKAAAAFEKSQRLRDAVHAYAELERLAAPTSRDRLEALLGQARCFEALGLDELERDNLIRAKREFGDRPLPVNRGDGLVAELVDRKLTAGGGRVPSRTNGGNSLVTRSETIQGEERIVSITGTPPSRLWMPHLRWSTGQLTFFAIVGKPAWEAPFAKPVRWAQFGPTGVVVGAEDRMTCFGYESGNVVWESALEADGATSTGFARFGNVILAARRSRLLAVDIHDGHWLWEYLPTGGGLHSGIRRLGDWAAVISASTIAVVDPQTGRPVAELPRLDDSQSPALALIGSRVVYGSDVATLAAFDTRTGAQAWSTRISRPSTDGAKLYSSDGKLFLMQDGYELSRLDGADGRELWRHRIAVKPQRFSEDAFMVNGDTIYLGAEGWMEARNAETGAAIWNQPLPENFMVATIGSFGTSMVFGAASEQESLLAVVAGDRPRLTQLLRIATPPISDPFQFGISQIAVVGRSATTIVTPN